MKQLLTLILFLTALSAHSSECESNKCKATYFQCLQNANGMNSSEAENLMRIKCFYYFENDISFKDCTDNAADMATGSGIDELRVLCFESFQKDISFSQCIKNASGFYSNTEEDKMRNRCFDKYLDDGKR